MIWARTFSNPRPPRPNPDLTPPRPDVGGRVTLVAVVMGSASDWSTMRAAVDVLEGFGVPHEARVVSAHRMPDEMFEFAEGAAARGLRAIIAGAGGAAHLPGCSPPRRPFPCSAFPCRRATSTARTRCCRSCRCRPACPSPRSPSARPGQRTPRCSPSPSSPPTTTELSAALDAYRGRPPRPAPRAATLPPLVTVTSRRRRSAMLGGGQLGRYSARRRPHDGLRHGRARSRPAGAGRAASPTSTSSPPTTTRAALDHLADDVRRRHDRVREPAGHGAGAAGRGRRRRAQSPGRSRSPRTAWTRSEFLADRGVPDGAVRRRRRGRRPTGDRLPGDPQDGPPGLRRQGPARRRRPDGAGRRVATSSAPCLRPRTVACPSTPSSA